MRLSGISVDRTSDVPLHRQLADALREAIRAGRLAPRERIVSTRELRTHLGVSRNTIVDAFEQLHAEGYLITTRGVGTFVADFVPSQPAQISKSDVQPQALSTEAEASLEVQSLAANLDVTLPFRPGVPALDAFPVDVFRRCMRADDWTERVLDYPDPQGHEPLRTAIAQRLRQVRGIDCAPDRVFITNGAQAAFTMLARALLPRGSKAIVEDPGYPNVRAVLAAQGVQSIAVAVDEAGIDTALFAKKKAQLAYVTPSHQYPSGAVLSLERRFALLEWAQRSGAWIVEDDYDSEFNYTGRPQPALCALGGDRVCYTGTFSKVLSPALRIAYVVVPEALRQPLRAYQIVSGGSPDTLVQAAVARFMSGGHFGRHITKMRKLYDERRRFAAKRLERSGMFAVRDSLAGLHFIATLRADMDDAVLSQNASEHGLIVPALSSYYAGAGNERGLVIGYAATATAQAARAFTVLERLVSGAGR